MSPGFDSPHPQTRDWFRLDAYFVTMDILKCPPEAMFRTLIRSLLSFGLLEHQLRSAALKPTFALNEFGMGAPWSDAVAEVVAKRSQLIGETSFEGGTDDEKHGRLLLFLPSETLVDGAAQHSSNGCAPPPESTPKQLLANSVPGPM